MLGSAQQKQALACVGGASLLRYVPLPVPAEAGANRWGRGLQFCLFFKTEVYLVYIITLVSGVQHSDSVFLLIILH